MTLIKILRQPGRSIADVEPYEDMVGMYSGMSNEYSMRLCLCVQPYRFILNWNKIKWV